MIPMVDLKTQYMSLQTEIEANVQAVLESGYYVLGPEGKKFEAEVNEYLGTNYSVGVSSGTEALHLALRALEIGPGDEVITTPFTFIANMEAIYYVGAKPVFVDIDKRSMNINAELIEQAITPATRAIMPVHLFGLPCDMDQINAIASRCNLAVIEDCAQSFGATYKNKQTGNFGIAGCFSFYPSKNLGCLGDGGMVTTNSNEMAEKLRMLRNHGSNKRYYHDLIGFNSRLDEIQAGILRVKLRHIDSFNKERRRVAALYNKLLDGLPLERPTAPDSVYHVFGQYTILTSQRDMLVDALGKEGISSAIHYPVPLHKQPVKADQFQGMRLPVCEDVASQCLSLPIYPELPDSDIVHICNVIKDCFSSTSHIS